MAVCMKEPGRSYKITTKIGSHKCWICGSNIGVYKHHIDPENRDKTRTVWLCESHHNKVEENPEFLAPSYRHIEQLTKSYSDDGHHFLYKDGRLLYLGEKKNGLMHYQNRLMTWEEYGEENQNGGFN